MENTLNALFEEKSITKAFSIKELADVMAFLAAEDKKDFTIKECNDSIILCKKAILEILKRGYKVSIPGFITIAPNYIPTRHAMNLITREPITVPEHIGVRLKAGQTLKTVCKDLSQDTGVFDFYQEKWTKKQPAVQ